MANWVEFTAKTVNDAVTEASIKLQVTSDMLEYEVIETGKSGFLGIFSKPAKIRARKKVEEPVKTEPVKKQEFVKKQEEKKTPIKRENKSSIENKGSVEKNISSEKVVEKIFNKPVEKNVQEQKEEIVVKKEISSAEIEKIAKKFLTDVFATMDIKANMQVFYNEQENLVEVNIEGDEMGILIGKRGQTLDSLQYLVSLVINKESSSYLKVKLDIENYRERRKETLENLAKNISYKVKRTKRPVSLEPMNPYERRIIHSALQGDKFVETHSEGEEPYRRVVVTLKKNYREYNNRGNGRNYNRNHNKKNYEKKNNVSSETKAVATVKAEQ